MSYGVRFSTAVFFSLTTLNPSALATPQSPRAPTSAQTSVVALEGARAGCQGTFLNLNRDRGDVLLTSASCLNNLTNGGVAITKNGRQIFSEDVTIHPYLREMRVADPTRITGLLDAALVRFPPGTGTGMSPIAANFVTAIAGTFASLFQPILSLGLRAPAPVPPQDLTRAEANTFRPGAPIYDGQGSLLAVSRGCEVGPDGVSYGCTAVSLHDQTTRQLLEAGRIQFGDAMAQVRVPLTSHELGGFRLFACRRPVCAPQPVYYYQPAPVHVVQHQPVAPPQPIYVPQPIYMAAYQPPPVRMAQHQNNQQHQNNPQTNNQSMSNSGNSSNANTNTANPRITIHNNPTINVTPNITVTPHINVNPQMNNGSGNSNSNDQSRRIGNLQSMLEDTERRLEAERRARELERQQFERIQNLNTQVQANVSQQNQTLADIDRTQQERIQANTQTLQEQEQQRELRQQERRLENQNQQLQQQHNEEQSRIIREGALLASATSGITREERLLAQNAVETTRRQLAIVASAQESIRYDIAQANLQVERERATRVATLLRQAPPTMQQLASISGEFGGAPLFSVPEAPQPYLAAYARTPIAPAPVEGLQHLVAAAPRPVGGTTLAGNQTPVVIAANSSPFLPGTAIAQNHSVGRNQLASLIRQQNGPGVQLASVGNDSPTAERLRLPPLSVFTLEDRTRADGTPLAPLLQ